MGKKGVYINEVTGSRWREREKKKEVEMRGNRIKMRRKRGVETRAVTVSR